MDKKHVSQFFILVVCLSLVSNGCGAIGTDLQKKYGADASYFIALDSLKNNDEETALRLLKECAKAGSPVIARRSAERLASLGSVQDKIKNSLDLYQSFPDEDSLLQIVRELDKDGEFARILTLTQDIDVTTCNNELAYYHCHSLLEKKDPRFSAQYFQWCTSRAFGAEQFNLFTQITDTLPDVINFRVAVYRQDYGTAYDAVRTICSGTAKDPVKSTVLTDQILSDAGKACLYGSGEYLHNAYYFDSLASRASKNNKFYAYFYAGRLYDRADNSGALSVARLKKAMECATSDQKFDNALWYYLNGQLKDSIPNAISSIKEYRTKWHDSEYFDDFFDTLSVRLLSQHLWSDFYTVANLLDGHASDGIVAKYSYIAGRLIETGFLKPDNQSATEAATALFTRALSSGSDLYYKLLAAKRLELSNEDIQKIMYPQAQVNSFQRSEDEERLLEGYADFGFPDEIYQEWQRSSSSISVDSVKKIAGFLQQCGDGKNNFYSVSLRIAAKKFNNSETVPDDEMLQLVYPQDFHKSVSKACKQFDMPEYLLYALIRSESFFDPQIVSHAGAIGLTQLMGSTAGDIARKLKKDTYDLNDSDTNILFGCYYLEEMRRRLDGSSILALFAYNGGISRVRTWVNSANMEFGTNSLPKDLFLEALPFAETREYGRKVVSAAAMYGYLYYGKTTSEVIDEILQ